MAIDGNHDAEGKVSRRIDYPSSFKRLGTKPEAFPIEDLGVIVHGQSYAVAATTDNIALGYGEPAPGYFNIGLLHTALAGEAGHEPYAPCTVEQLRQHGYGYWALGHVHRMKVVSEDPYIIFPGNIQGRQLREGRRRVRRWLRG